MASPALVRVAVVASVATTGAAAFYFLSDGGDPQKFDANLREARAKIDSTVATLVSPSTQVKEVTPAGNVANATETKRVEDVKDGESKAEIREPSPRHAQPQTGAYCHTCSGPRIWFFAEKLRLKRRITPYPDPPRD